MKISNLTVCPNTTTSSDETVVNSAYAVITDATASSNETLKLQRNPAYVTRRNIISETDATYTTSGDETLKLQRNPAYVTISDASRNETTELQRNPAYAMNTASTAVSDKGTTCIASRYETIKLQQNPAYVAITDDISDNRIQTMKLQSNPTCAVITTSITISDKTGSTNNEPMMLQRNPMHNAVSENINNETIVNRAYALISGKASSNGTIPVHDAATENTNSDETLVNPLYAWVKDDKCTTISCSDKTVEVQRNAVYVAISENTTVTTNSDETIVIPAYVSISGKGNAASRDETIKLQRNLTISDNVATSAVEMIELQRNPAHDISTVSGNTTASTNEPTTLQHVAVSENISDETIVNQAYAPISGKASSNETTPVHDAVTENTNSDETLVNPLYAWVDDDKCTTVSCSDKTVEVQRNPVHVAISENTTGTTNNDETIVIPAYVSISSKGNAASRDETIKLQRNPVHSATIENTNSDETIVNPLYAQVDHKHTTASCTDKTVEVLRNPAYTTAVVPPRVHLYEEI